MAGRALKIGFFTDTYAPKIDGIAVSVDLFRRELEALGHEVYVICPAAPGRSKEAKPHEVRLPSWPGPWYEGARDTFPWTPGNIERIKSLGLDIIHTHTPNQIGMLGLQMAIGTGTPLVVTYHTDTEEYAKVYKRFFPGIVTLLLLTPILTKDLSLYRQVLPLLKPESDISRWNQRMVSKWIGVYLGYADLVIAPSPRMHDLLGKYGVEAPIEILPTGLPEAIEPSSGDLRYEHGLPADSQIVLFSGRLGAEKNIELFVRTAVILAKSHPRAYFVLAGDGPNRAKLEQQIKKLKLTERFVLTGMLSAADLARVYLDANVYFFPSLTDTQGLVLSEAAQAGLPLVWVDDEISPVTRDGKNGYRVDPNPQSAAKAIASILDDGALAKRFGRESRRLAETIGAANQAAKLAGYYDKILQ